MHISRKVNNGLNRLSFSFIARYPLWFGERPVVPRWGDNLLTFDLFKMNYLVSLGADLPACIEVGVDNLRNVDCLAQIWHRQVVASL